ncbi:MAG TPA: hypothetical protein VN690_09105 [Terriglobales bacterium]|nr:hypothetical protein [Terriglobales bacterium]
MLKTALVMAAAAVLSLAQTAPPAGTKPADPIAPVLGTWECSVSVQGQDIPVVLHLTKNEKGALAASLDDVMNQGNGELDASATYKDGALHVDVPSLPSSFDGTMSSDTGTIDGSWNYNGGAVGCSFAKDKS